MADTDKTKIIFQPSGRRGEVEKGVTIIEASRQLGVDIESLCGEKKVCGKCTIRIEEGYFEKYGIQSSKDHAGEWLIEEEKFINREQREAGYRLGCCARVEGDLLVFVPEESRAGKQIVSKAARDIHIEWNPAVEYYYVEVSEPTIQEPTGDLERILEELNHKYGLKNLDIDYLTLQRLPGKIKDYYGMAIDVGTTTVAAYLCNIATMEVVDTVSMMNPQCKYGEDVMSRITYHMMHQDGLAKMSADIIAGLNSLVTQACEATHPPKKGKKNGSGKEETIKTQKDTRYLCLNPTDIIDMTIVGNTAMHHILLKLNPEYVGIAPFPPAVHKSMNIKARDLRIQIHESAYVYILPNEAGFVGADNVGVLIAEEPYKKDEMQLIIDIGTNGELVLGNKKKLISSSCATGPALEGAQLTFGMRAAPGAIERIKIDPDSHEVDYKVIGRDTWKTYSKSEEMQTKGICGSGILDVFAELYRSGIILKSGKFNPNQKNSRFRKNTDNNQPEFVIAWAHETTIGKDIVITQKDVRQIQLAKGALYCGCKLMMRRMGIDKVEKVKIAGAFGTHVDREKALIMGLFPDCEIEKIISIGNAAGDGARAALLNREKREEANWVSRNVEYIELTVEKDFQQEFMEALQIPHMTDEFPHLEGIVPDEILNQ
ncbi:MAG: DUF4445 domain-containing protein [Deltaproteobacteria bacterium]|nr:DUF4445 domain-containing protein [Deltaproteobacteria bacterium]